VGNSLNAQEEIASADYPRIRHIKIAKKPEPSPRDDLQGSWQVCSPSVVAGFSAAAYFFGRDLLQELDVPIGLINTSWGGTRIEPWTPVQGFAEVPELESIYQQVCRTLPSEEEYKTILRDYLTKLDAWLKNAQRSMENGTITAPAPPYPAEIVPMTGHQQPTTLYNGMVNGFVPFAIRGAIWYQGESNHREGTLYTAKMKALIEGWRSVWNQGEFPFLYVQIAPYRYGSEDPTVLPVFWEAQADALAIPNTGMVVTNDIGDTGNIHPKNKQAVGHRLALIALAKTYGRDHLVYSGPTFRDMTVEGKTVRIAFDHVGSGLASRDGKPLTWFEIIGQETDFMPADAVIDGDTVVLSADGVTNPAAVRFGWHKNAEPNLMNKEGLPARPFRAGTVPDRDFLALRVPEAADYQLVYDLDLATLAKTVRYTVDNREKIGGPFDRIAYFLELQKHGEQRQYVYVSMDAFTDDLAKIGLPTLDSGASFQIPVASLNVISNVSSIATGNDMPGGNIEFWPNNYGPPNSAKVPNASGSLWDFGDQMSDPVDGYGCMQVHNHDAKQTVFAINTWKSGPNADIGIGNSEGRTRDWTFTKNAGQYSVKRLRVLVRPAN
jgi:sialate O-acetylesterase